MSILPNVTREQVYLALFAQVQGISWGGDPSAMPVIPPTTWITTTRRIKIFADVPMDQQPWLGQAEHAEQIMQKSNLPYKRTFEAKWIVYQSTGTNKDVAGAIENNLILDALQLALTPKPFDPGYPNRNTLGGLAYHAFIDGEIFKDPGDLDDQAMMVIPVKVLVP